MKSFRRSLRVLGLLLFASHAVEIGEAQTPPTRILPLGDSLTSGTSVVGAYRNRLYTLLTGAGFNVDFVGTQADANNPTLPDRDHQGMGGYRIDQIQAGLSSWLNAIADPDVVLLMIGTNDFSGNYNVATAQNRLASLVTDIATKRPFAKIVLASLPLRTDDPNLEALQSAFNASIPGIVSAQVAQGHQVSFLDMHAVLLSGDFVEGVHPTATGYDKMANAWFPAVTSVITPLGTANPPAIAHTEPAVDLQHVAVTFSKPVADTAANIANFSLNGGLSISQAVLDPATKRTITLTTSAQTASTLYTLTVSGVRDRTPAQNLIAAGSTVAYSSFSLLNGSFESGETGWTMTGNYQIYNTAPPYIASDGTKMVILNGGQTPPTGQVSQTFPTVPGQSYVLDFDMGILALNTFEQKVGVEITGTVPLLSVTDSVFGNGLGDSVWAAKSHTFIANSTTTNLTLRDLSPTSNGIDLLLDHVRVTAIAKPANTAPTAVADAYSAIKDIALTVPAGGVLSNDTDPESNVLSAALNAGPSHGSVTLNANGGFTYTPAAGYTGPDSFTYHANDANLNSNIATVTITVSALTPGTLVNGSFESGQSGWTMTGNFLVYANNPPYIAFDGVTMVVMNGGQTPPTGVISQTFPTVPGQTYALDFNVGSVATNSSEQKLGVEIIGSVTLLSVTDSVFGNSQGNSVWTAKSHTFTANSAMSTLTFRDLSPTSDGVDLLLDNVRLTAIASPVNTAPVAVADSYSATQNTALIVSAAGVLLNDTDAESNVLTAVLNAGPSHGSVTLNANGGFTYTSTTGYTGADSFTYHANDGNLNSNIATVNITVSAPTPGSLVNGSFESGQTGWTMTGNFLVYANNPPYTAFDGTTMVVMNGVQSPPNAVISQTFTTVSGQSYALDFNVGILALNSSEQRLGVEITGATQLLSQTTSLFGNGQGNSVWTAKSYAFTANGSSTTLAFRDLSPTSDGVDLLLDNVRITATGTPNTAPVAVADSYSTNQNTALVVAAAGVLANDTDAQSNALTAVLNVGPSHGSLNLGANGGFTYTPTASYSGADSFTYHANDGSLNSNIVTVSINVVTVNTAPVAVADSYSTNQNTALVVAAAGVLTNDTDAQANSLTAVLNGGPSHGSLNLSANGGFTYTPTTGYSGADSFTYHANDGSLNSNIVTASINVLAVNTAPVAAADSYSTNQGTALVVSAAGVLSNDTDAQANSLTAVLNVGPSHGSVTLNANGGFTYTPTASYSGADSFTYHANDGSLDSNIVTVSISVLAPSSDVLANGSFEADFTGWTATGNEVIKSTAPYLATDGVKLVAFNSGNLTPDAVLTQTFATVTGQTYTLTFDTGVIGYVKKQQKLDVTVTGAGSLVSKNVIINSVSDGVAHWISKSYSFVADSTTATLTFADRSTTTDALDLLLDKVRVTGPPAFANGAPTAVADAYSINKDSTLTVTAPGILTNDTDLQLNILTAVLENGPSHGSLTLSASGGFTYKPTAGYSGADSFTYHANDGSLDSNSVTVNLTVNSVVPGLLVNPSFESGFTGWTATGNQSIEFYPTTDGIRMVAFNGQNLTPNAVLSQTFATTVGQTYSLTFDAAVLAYTSDPQTLQVSTKGTGNLLTQSITLTGSDGVIRWLPQAYSFTADSTSTTLIFRDLSTATIGLDLLLDNVRVVAAPSGSIASFAIPPVAAPSLGTPSISVAPGDAVISMIAPHAGNYVLEASEDLQTWQIIDSIQCYDQEPIEFHDPTPLGTEAPRPKLFYRIGLQPDSPAN